MAPNYQGRRLIDSDGNYYIFECPMDVNANQVEDILLSTDQGITKLVGYRLAIDGIYKDMEDQHVEPQSKYNFYKKIQIFDEGQTVSQEEFGKTMKDLIAKAKVSRIGKIKVTSWRGEQVFEDGRGYFLKRIIKCHGNGCSNKIEGVIRLSTDPEGAVTRGQNFTPNDKGVSRARPGSKLWMCPACSVVSIPVPLLEPELPPTVDPEPTNISEPFDEKTIKVPKVFKKDKIMNKLTELSDVDSSVSAEYLKGYLSAALEFLKGD